MKLKLIITAVLFVPFLSQAQLGKQKKTYTKEDTLRGSLNENRDWWDVLEYEIEVKPDFESRTIEGKVRIEFNKTRTGKTKIQLDIQQPLIVDSIKVLYSNFHLGNVEFIRDSNVAYFNYPINNAQEGVFIVYYHGKPREAKNAPWDGGWIWKKDSLGRPWMSVAVQGLGASAWYPCKDHQSDEPDEGASLTVIVPDSLIAIANGKERKFGKGEQLEKWDSTSTRFVSLPLKKYIWSVGSPINNYNIVPYIGKYVNWIDTFELEDIDTMYVSHDTTMFIAKRYYSLNFWVLDYNFERAKQHFQQVKPMLRCFEFWFGRYPFGLDGYKLVESPHLGMEHQSAIAYGNKYRNGYLGMDLSRTGWGSKWDYIIVHESGHEWFANNISTKDIADMWVHEGFTCYSETLYTEWLFGKQAGDEYNIAFHGSWNRAPRPQEGYFVVFLPFKNGMPGGEYEIFADGFAGKTKTPQGADFRPCGLAQGPDGSLFICDDQKGRIWKVSYKTP